MPAPLVPTEVIDRPPSREDDIDAVTEEQLRRYGAELIQRAGSLLRVPQVIIVSGAVVFHRFYFRKSFAAFDVRNLAAGAMFLACKLEENPRKLRDVIVVFWRLKIRDEDAQENGNAAYSGTPTPALDEKGREYIELKTEVSHAERHILRELGFEVGKLLDHPHKFILQYVNSLNRSNALAQRAWGYLNDSLRTTLCCLYEPHQIAAAAIYLAARTSGIRLPSSPPWWEVFDASLEDMRKIAGTIMALYQRPRAEYLHIPKRKRAVPDTPAMTPVAEIPPARSPEDEDQLVASGDAAELLAQSQLDPSRIAELLEERLEERDDGRRTGNGGNSRMAPPPQRQGSRLGPDDDEAKRRLTREKEHEKGKERDRDRERDREKEKDREREKRKDRQRAAKAPQKDRKKEQPKRGSRSSSRSSSSRRSAAKREKEQKRSRSPSGKKQRDRGRDKKRPRTAVSVSSANSDSSSGSESESARRPKRRNPAKYGVDEQDI